VNKAWPPYWAARTTFHQQKRKGGLAWPDRLFKNLAR
jgi:hypothetical protein